MRAQLRACLDKQGLRVQVEERVGDFPSPTVLVDGVDVTGTPAGRDSSRRLDLPTEERIRAALNAAAH